MPFKPHPEYEKYAPQWDKCRVTTEGEDAVKDAGTRYLPALEGRRDDPHKSRHYVGYKKRAVFYGAMGRTVLGLAGAVMRRPPTVQGEPFARPDGQGPEQAALLAPVGYAGDTLLTMVHETVRQVLEVGRVGHLLDAPPEGSEDVSPYIVKYDAEDIITWHEESVRGRKKLVLVVLREQRLTPNPDMSKGLEMDETTQYRVLRLVSTADIDRVGETLLVERDFEQADVYVQELYIETAEIDATTGKPGSAKKLTLLDRAVPRGRNGAPLDYIPFRFTGAETDGGPSVAKPPLVDLANLNLSHYRNSADLEHGQHYGALPTPWAAGFALEGDALEIGSNTAWISENPQARVGMLEFSGPGLGSIRESMANKERQMASIGARFLEETKAVGEAAETLKLRQSGDRAMLNNVATAVSASWTWLLTKIFEFSNIQPPTDVISLIVNTDFISAKADAQFLNVLTQMLQTGSISWQTYVEQLQEGEIIDHSISADEERERIEQGIPSVGESTADFPPNNAPGQAPARRRVSDVEGEGDA